MGTLLTFYRRAVAGISTVFFTCPFPPLNRPPISPHAWKWFFFLAPSSHWKRTAFDWRLFAFVSLQVSARPRKDTWVENILFYCFFYISFAFFCTRHYRYLLLLYLSLYLSCERTIVYELYRRISRAIGEFLYEKLAVNEILLFRFAYFYIRLECI